jgi:hypothetical protein
MTDSTKPAARVPSEQPERLSLSATQILASGLAAVSATVAASYFGVAGTVIGAALGSVISVVGGAIYSYSIRQTHSRVRQSLDVAVSQRFSVRPREDRQPLSTGLRSVRSALNPRRLSLAAAGLFLLVLAATTGFELASGQPLAATVSGKHGSGTSLDGGRTSKPSTPASHSPAGSSSSSPRPTVTVTVPASSVPTSGSPGSSSPSSDPPSSDPPTSNPPSSEPPASSAPVSSSPPG